MHPSLAAILAPLEPIKDRVFMLPCSPAEIDDLRKALSGDLPQQYVVLLETIGLIQDLFHGKSRALGGMRLSSIRFKRSWSTNDFFPFAQEGEDTFILRHSATDDRVYQATPGVSPIEQSEYSLSQYLARCVEDKRRQQNLLLNTEKSWHVQFSIKDADEKRMVDVLQKVAQMEDSGEPWLDTGTSPAEVKGFRRELRRFGQIIEIRRREHSDWKSPGFSMDYVEPVMGMSAGSVIRSLDRAFLESRLEYALVDYGLMPTILPERKTPKGKDSPPSDLLSLDRKFYESLGQERVDFKCRAPGCTRGAIPLSVMCRKHHFQQIKRRECPFE